jgi:NodT family efflux transporter outer membrane factor (OMF) lipoprotein
MRSDNRVEGIRAALMLVLVCGTLASCASKPEPDRAAVLNDALPSVVVPGAWGSAAEKGTVPDGWLRSFNDAGLEAIVGEAMKNNLDLRVAQSKLDVAAGAAGAAGAALKPTVSASGAGSTTGGSSDARMTSRGVGLNMSWELDVWGRLRAQSGAAQLKYEGAELDYEFARQSIAAATAKAWFLATETRMQQKIAAQQVETLQEMLRVIEARRAAGKASEQDVRLTRADLASAQERQESTEAARKQTVRALEALVGRYPSAELETAAELPAMPGPVPAGVPSEVLERRPDVAAAERKVFGAFKNVKAKKLAKLPSIALTGGVGASSDLSGITGRSGGFFNIGANFFAPIFDGGARDAEVKIATAEQEGALAAYGQAALRAFVDVENTLESDVTLAKREELLAGALKDNEEALRLRKVEAEAGKADTLSVLQLQAKVDTARSGLISLRQARRAERVNLHMALGGGFQ